MITHDRGDEVQIIKGGPLHEERGEVLLKDTSHRPTLYTVRLDTPMHSGRQLVIIADDEMITQSD